MGRIIVNNKSSRSDADAVFCVHVVVRDGRISDNGRCYCYATVFKNLRVSVVASRTKGGTDTFTVCDDHAKGGEA